MEFQESVSKGCFVYKPKKIKDPFNEFDNEIWDEAFTNVWTDIETKLKTLNDGISRKMVHDLINYVRTSESTFNKIPTGILLVGVNIPDHGSLFGQIVSFIKKEVTQYVAVLSPLNCSTVKNIVEQMTGQLMNESDQSEMDCDDVDSDEEMKSEELKKSKCNMPYLLEWYKNLSPNKRSRGKNKLVVVLPDFEGFKSHVLHNFFLILSGYVTQLPIVLVLGVATTVTAIGDSLEHSVTSKLSLELFQSERSVYYLNNVLDKVFLTADCPFQLGPSIFKFLTNVFLFYDFSVCNYTLGIKYCLMNHFFKQPLKVLCCDKKDLKEVLNRLSKGDLKNVFEVPSFKQYFESLSENEKELLKNDHIHLKKIILQLLKNCHKKLKEFYACIHLLKILVSELPQAPLGKQVREIYSSAITGNINKSLEYRESHKLLCFLSKDELISKIDKMMSFIDEISSEKIPVIDSIKEKLSSFKKDLDSTGHSKLSSSPMKSPRKLDITSKSRSEFMKKLATLSKTTVQSGYELLRENLMDYLFVEVFPSTLQPITNLTLHEILVCDSESSLKRRFVGCPRADLHLALTDPHHYLQCDCCSLENPDQILDTLPDICILYKLHLESGSLINMYDWLQSFATIINPESAGDDKLDITPQVQARFTQAVAELELLGFIKSSRRKTDHVSRLTWGGCT